MAVVLIVDDEPDIRNSVKLALRGEGYTIVEAENGKAALTGIESCAPDLIILDYMMPELDGIGTLRALREHPRCKLTPIIMLTALSDDMAILRCFEAGADSYINKPFKFVHLQMQVKALLARARVTATATDASANDDALIFHSLVVKPASHTVTISGKSVDLTPKEYDLLKYLLSNPNKLLSRDDILDNVWGYDFAETRTVDYHLSKLREKLAACAEFSEALKNVRGRGYRLDVTP